LRIIHLAQLTRERGRSANEPRFDVRTALYYVTGVDLTELEGIAEVTALVVVSDGVWSSMSNR